MTRSEVYRLVRKLHHRRKLIDEVEAIESRLAVYLTSHNLTEVRTPGLKATLLENEIIITETPLWDERQLNLLGDYFCLEHERRA
ncbi:MAG: hypothetical protein M1461_13045 [Nitrospirae bacterium]|nr:hypothetical protein [Nitrospirota bacterium]